MNGLRDSIAYFFNSNALNPHGICLMWRPELIWTHAISDILIGVAYFSIPLALGVFLWHRRDVKFSWAIWMFVGFIMLCGVTHFMMVWTLWNPDYGIEALIKASTAAVSIVTAFALWPLLPRVIALPSPTELERRIAERDAALADLRAAMDTMVEMREHEARQKLLLDELNHRVKNTLASVQSIAVQTLSREAEPEAARATFVERLMALSSTHNLLVKRSWEGASFQDLVQASLDHYGQPFALEGPDLTMAPNTAVSLGMALHELATNALKYGAWSNGGRVEISTRVDVAAAAMRIVWRERGGPAVEAPGRRGFGSRLLEQGVAGELGGEVSLDFGGEGLTCTIQTPIGRALYPDGWVFPTAALA
ncbi:sensor histidine kinase [Phenylobacterium sp.]|uniref:sensor histidine kinase n=1 Tax=Phenylobacterium sp. TaxID=1871053 RepID=UPI0027313347|nr:sensor histidine kinase [Phenylobacterium sp.]MDP1618144.1 sensor histidine kinase [Phenylobacterium sp.]MDP1988441.1 sensor histidine kinase [Phenylobacterium sp.]